MAVMGLPCLYFSCNVASDTRLVDDRVSGTAVSLKYFSSKDETHRARYVFAPHIHLTRDVAYVVFANKCSRELKIKGELSFLHNLMISFRVIRYHTMTIKRNCIMRNAQQM